MITSDICFSGTNPSAQIVIIDVEYTTWEGTMQRNWAGPNEYREVVQVYACGVSTDNFEIIWEKEWLTRPIKNPILSQYFINLTGIEQAKVDVGTSQLRAVVDDLKKLSGGQEMYSWGDGDEGALRDSCKIQNIAYSDYLPHIFDIRPIFAACGIDTTKYQSGTVCHALNISIKGQQHDSKYDVTSMVETLKHLSQNNSLSQLFVRQDEELQ